MNALCTLDALATLPLAADGATGLIDRYRALGPLSAAFLANLVGTFGDKGQLVVVTLAAKYDAKRVFAGAMAAFAAWSAVEVALGTWITTVLPAGAMRLVTGTLFVAFGLWTFFDVESHLPGSTLREKAASLRSPPIAGDGEGVNLGIAGRFVPDRLRGATGGLATSFAFIAFAEFGDKTQILTINLAATFPDAPLAVFAGVVAALALQTGFDAFVGERLDHRLPTRYIELAVSILFVGFGLFVFDLLGSLALLALVGVAAAIVLYGAYET